MLGPKSLLHLIIPARRESSFVDVDHLSYPFSSSLDIGHMDIEESQELVEELCEWLDTTIGPIPKWGISRPLTWWGTDDTINMTFLFKLKEDAVAFKLRWV